MNFQNLLNKIDALDQGTSVLKEQTNKNVVLTSNPDLNAIKQLSGLNENAVAECGMMPSPMQHGTPVSMNVSLNASGADNIRDLLDLISNKAGELGAGPVGGPIGAILSVKSDNNAGPAMDLDGDRELDEPGEMHRHDEPELELDETGEDGGFQTATTEPNEEYAGVQAVIPKGNDLSSKGGNEVEKVNGGGNPYAVTTESLKAQLSNLYQEVRLR